MRSRFIRVFFFTLALSLLALSCCAFACADGEAVDRFGGELVVLSRYANDPSSLVASDLSAGI